MKRLILFVLTLFAVGAADASLPTLQWCADPHGTWSGLNSTFSTCNSGTGCTTTYTIPTYSSSGGITGATFHVTNGSTVNCTYSVTGSYTPANNGSANVGNFSYSATLQTGGTGCPSGSSQNFNAAFAVWGNGCQTLTDYGIGSAATRSYCEIPGTGGANGENSSTLASPIWGGHGGSPYYANFFATLNDSTISNFNFSGRTVQEYLTPLTPTHPCPAYPGGVTNGWGSTWYPDTSNYSVGPSPWPDSVGIGANGYYDQQWIGQVQHNYSVALPCSVFLTQQDMYIDCAGDSPHSPGNKYETHNLEFIIGDGYIDSKRNGKDAGNSAFGNIRQVLRADDSNYLPLGFTLN